MSGAASYRANLNMTSYSYNKASGDRPGTEPGPGAAPRRSQQRRERTRAALFAAGLEVFAARGFQDASVAAITETADLGVGTFYLHFPDKISLLQAMLAEGITQVRLEVGAATDPLPERGAFSVLVRALFRSAAERRTLFRVALAGGRPPGVAATAAQGAAPGVARVLRGAVDRGELSPAEVPLLVRLIAGTLYQAVLWLADDPSAGPDAVADATLRLLTGGLPRSLLDEGPGGRALGPGADPG